MSDPYRIPAVFNEVPIFIVKTDNGFMANNVGPGLAITFAGGEWCDCLECRWYRRYVGIRDIKLFNLKP